MRRPTARHLTAPLAAAALLATTAAGCGSSAAPPKPGATLVVVGTRAEDVGCTETPYDYALGQPDPAGTGISVIHGVVRGSMKVACTPPGPDTFYIQVILVRDGAMLSPGSPYSAVPNVVGYEAWTIVTCVPGTYRLHYLFKWTLAGAVQTNKTATMTAPKVVTQHDCDES